MLCGFENNVFVEYINREGWSEISHFMSMRATDVIVFHMVESNGWIFKEIPNERMYKYSKDSSCIMQEYLST